MGNMSRLCFVKVVVSLTTLTCHDKIPLDSHSLGQTFKFVPTRLTPFSLSGLDLRHVFLPIPPLVPRSTGVKVSVWEVSGRPVEVCSVIGETGEKKGDVLRPLLSYG